MSKIAIMSDIHSNPKAFNRALSDARKEGCTRFYCLGDVVGYGYAPNECIRIATSESSGLKGNCLLGNHDAGVAEKLSTSWFNDTAATGILRQRKEIGEHGKEWLSSLEYRRLVKSESGFNIFMAHGGYVSETNWYGETEMFPYVTECLSAEKNMREMARIGESGIMFLGHTHDPCIFDASEGHFRRQSERSPSTGIRERHDIENGAELDPGKGFMIVNVGSVGYARTYPFSTYVILDDCTGKVEFRILRFFFREYVEDMKTVKIPVPLWMGRWYDPENDKYADEEGYVPWTQKKANHPRIVTG